MRPITAARILKVPNVEQRIQSISFKRKVTLTEDKYGVWDEDHMDDQKGEPLPPVEMFTTKVKKDDAEMIEKSALFTDSKGPEADFRKGDQHDGNANAPAADGDSTSKTKYYTQVSSIVRPQVPVYPDVEKPFKTVVQDVLDSKTLQGHMGVILCLFFDGIRLYSGGSDSVIRLWHPRGNRCLLKFLGHKGGIHALDYCAQTHTLYSGSWDTTIRKWDVGESKAAGVMSGHGASVTSVCVLTTTHLLSSSYDGTLRLWNSLGCECLKEFRLMSESECELKPLLRMEVLGYRDNREFTINFTTETTISATLCTDGSVFVAAVKRDPPVIKTESVSSDAGSFQFVRWVPWKALHVDKKVVHKGMALTVHGELLAVATYGTRMSTQTIIGRRIEVRNDSETVARNANNQTEGGVVWIARLHSTNVQQAKQLNPHLFAALRMDAMPTALCCAYGKLYIGFFSGAIQIWDLGDMIKIQEFSVHTSRIRDIKAGSDLVSSCDDDGKIVVTRLSSAMQTKAKPGQILKR